MKTSTSPLLLTLALVAAIASAQDNKPIAGIGPAGEIVQAHTGFKFTEGPAADAQGNVYFTDIPNGRIHKVDAAGKLSTFLENSQGCNGLMADARGRLIACQGGAGRVIAIEVATKRIEPLAETYNGKRFNAPNDLVVDRHGGVYFTDPSFGRGEP
ncbi:MAG: SMP-30/gluconolactonase/LRE family protein, partial [Verrucomicrobia bacterium]|nr:SMP-30/gluconolactonase/LRE family protein [Verrucomicrobiota bacterium]